MRMNTPGRRPESGRQEALAADVRVFVEAHLRDLARDGRLRELARSRDALVRHYRAQRNEAAAYILANAPDFSLALTLDGVRLTLPDRTASIIWTQSELLEAEQNAVDEVEDRAIELGGGPDCFRALSDEEREVLRGQAAEEAIKRLRGR